MNIKINILDKITRLTQSQEEEIKKKIAEAFDFNNPLGIQVPSGTSGTVDFDLVSFHESTGEFQGKIRTTLSIIGRI